MSTSTSTNKRLTPNIEFRPTLQIPSRALALVPGDRTLPAEHRDRERAGLMKDGR
jgi:hypothetical protein